MKTTSNFFEINLRSIRESSDLMLRADGEYTKDSKLEDLSKSLQREGMLHPLIVRKVSDDEYELICGYRRFKAIEKKANENNEDPKVMVRVIDRELTEKDKLGIMVEENSMRKDFITDELFRVIVAMDKAGFDKAGIIAKTGRSEKTVERMMLVGKDKYFYDLVQRDILKYTQANTLLSCEDDKLELLKETVNKWIKATEKKIAEARERMASSNRPPSGPTLKYHTYLPGWLIKNWLLTIGQGQEPKVDGEWKFGLLHNPETQMTNIPAIKISYKNDQIERLVDVYWKLRKETERIIATIEARKLQKEFVEKESEYGADYQEFIKQQGLQNFSQVIVPAPDNDIPERDEEDEPPEEGALSDVSDFIDDTGTDE